MNNKTAAAQKHPVVSPPQWRDARIALLAKEKELRHQMDEIARLRRELPWELVEKKYVFSTDQGPKTFAELFDGNSQLIVYHFMLAPDWVEGCKSCSFLADHFDGAITHLTQRDIAFTAISRAPFEKIDAFKKRMGWNFRWVSSNGSDFNFDYHVSFTPQQLESGDVIYNYQPERLKSIEWPGVSVFYKNDSGDVFHTYSTFARGLDILLGAYNFIDMTPKGRDEAGFKYPMEWVRHHDRYPAA